MEVRDLSFGFDAEAPLLIEGTSFYVGQRDRIGIIGRNGKGKTTLLNLLAGELTPVSGVVSHHKHLKLAYFGQTNIMRLDMEKTVEEEIMDAHPERSRNTARGICGAMMFPGDDALKKISVLSGGEKSRVLLGKLLVRPANLLLLDEPTNHLDMESTESLLEAVDDFGGAVIIVTHSEMILNALATRLIVFDDGSVSLFEGTYRDFLERVGWKHEAPLVQHKVKSSTTNSPPVNRKDLRRIRAELVTEKSRVLGTLKERIDWIESEIIRLEEQSEQDNKDLLAASLASDGNTIKRLSASIHKSKSRIESLFTELELLHAELDSKKTNFEERLKATEQ